MRQNHRLAVSGSHRQQVCVNAQQAVPKTGVLVHSKGSACVRPSLQGVMALQGEEDSAHAEETLRQLSRVLSQQGLQAPLELSLGGLSHFRNQARYGSVFSPKEVARGGLAEHA